MSHAKLFSPSKAERWFACPGHSVLEAEYPDASSSYSSDGTARHEVCAACLTTRRPVPEWVGRAATNGVVYKAEWVDEDQDYVDTVLALAKGGILFVEKTLGFRQSIGCPDPNDGFGTADALIFKPLSTGGFEVIVIDRKTGRGAVPVARNKQLLLYAVGACEEYGLVYDIRRVRLMIHQRSMSEWDCAIGELNAFWLEARAAAKIVQDAVDCSEATPRDEWSPIYLNSQPSEDACRYCKAMATCPSVQRTAEKVLGADFAINSARGIIAPDDTLARAMASAGLIEDWVKAVRGEVERRLLAGQGVSGFKLVRGKSGARAWGDAQAAEAELKRMRLSTEEMYDLKLISPTAAEKLSKAKGDAKPILGPRQWAKMQEHITRPDPKPSVAPENDPRERYVPPNPADDFALPSEATATPS